MRDSPFRWQCDRLTGTAPTRAAEALSTPDARPPTRSRYRPYLPGRRPCTPWSAGSAAVP